MAIVKEGISGTGARFRIFDDYYAGISAEEAASRKAHISMTAHHILVESARLQNTTTDERSNHYEQHPQEAGEHGRDGKAQRTAHRRIYQQGS